MKRGCFADWIHGCHFGGEVFNRHACKRGDENLYEILFWELRNCLPIAGQNGLEGLDVLQFGFLFRQRRYSIQAVHHLRIDRLLNPGRAILIECSDPFLGWYELGAPGVRCGLHEFDDRRFGRDRRSTTARDPSEPQQLPERSG